MTSALTTQITQNDTNTDIAPISDSAKKYVIESTSAATRKAYKSDLRIFAHWCNERNLPAMPSTPSIVADFIAHQAAEDNIGASTLNRRVAAIKYAHELNNLVSPTKDKIVSATLKGIRRNQSKPVVKKQAATIDTIYQLLAQIDKTSPMGKRDYALLILGFAGAFRRSELAALNIEDLAFNDKGIVVTIRKSKTDQDGQGQTIAIPNGKLNISGIVKTWIEFAGIESGALFRSVNRGGNVGTAAINDKTVARVIKKYAKLANLDASLFSGHSLRSGFITSAAESGANLFKIMDVSRHKSVETVRGYVRSAEQFDNHAGSSFL